MVKAIENSLFGACHSMAKSDEITTAYWNGIQELLTDDGSGVDFKAFSAVSERFLKEYRQLAMAGLPGHTVALAMLGATLNMYTIFGAHDQLPRVLRDLADILDGKARLQ